jgi:DNA-directed RNA polymerase subunit K/omega
MIRPPDGMGAYQFAVLASLRAAQLMHGCVPRVDGGTHKSTTTAQLEIMQGVTSELSPDTDQDEP